MPSESNMPSEAPSQTPSGKPSLAPSSMPSIPPSEKPSAVPSIPPSQFPTTTFAPSNEPTISNAPTNVISAAPTVLEDGACPNIPDPLRPNLCADDFNVMHHDFFVACISICVQDKEVPLKQVGQYRCGDCPQNRVNIHLGR